jgi:hypothetical protein
MSGALEECKLDYAAYGCNVKPEMSSTGRLLRFRCGIPLFFFSAA